MPTTQLSDLGRRGCECIGCGRLFWGVSAFDAHRLGKHGVNRRCATDEEMRAGGLALDERGVWTAEAARRKAAIRAGRDPDSRARTPGTPDDAQIRVEVGA